jgi:hypothetical protein
MLDSANTIEPPATQEPPAAQEPSAEIDISASQPLDAETLKSMMIQDDEEPQEEVEKPVFQ